MVLRDWAALAVLLWISVSYILIELREVKQKMEEIISMNDDLTHILMSHLSRL